MLSHLKRVMRKLHCQWKSLSEALGLVLCLVTVAPGSAWSQEAEPAFSHFSGMHGQSWLYLRW